MKNTRWGSVIEQQLQVGFLVRLLWGVSGGASSVKNGEVSEAARTSPEVGEQASKN